MVVARLTVVCLSVAGALTALPATAHAASAPRLRISAPTAVASGRWVSVSATVTAVPPGQTVRISMPGRSCGSTRWVARGAARVVCTFHPTAPGGWGLRATAKTYRKGRQTAAVSATSTVTSVGVRVGVPASLRLGEPARITITFGTTARPRTLVRLDPRLTSAVGCPAAVTLRVDWRRSGSYTCTAVPVPTASVRAAPQVSYAGTRLVAPTTSRALADGAPVPPSAAAQVWNGVAHDQLQLALTLAADRHDSAATGLEILLRAHRDGWDDPTVAQLVNRLLELRKDDGGWGLEEEWDAFGDGTPNDDDTTYTVTTAGHAGPALLGAWQHQLVDDEALRGAVDSVLATPAWPVPGGLCLSYSTSRNDLGTCVPNVSLGAAAWLKQVRSATGWSIPRLDEVVDGATGAARYLYQPATGHWAYSDLPAQRTRPQDPSHQGYTLQSVQVLDPALAASASRMFAQPWWQQPTRARRTVFGLGQAVVAAKDCSGAARSPALLDAFGAITSEPETETRFLAMQYAMYGQRVADVCFAGKAWARAHSR